MIHHSNRSDKEWVFMPLKLQTDGNFKQSKLPVCLLLNS